MKDELIKKRITEAIEEMGGNSSKMARLIGVTPNYLASVITSPKKGVSATLLKGFAKAGMNLNWLLKGQAGMWINNGNGKAIATLEMVQGKLDAALDLIEKLEYYVVRLEKLNQQSEGRIHGIENNIA
jgi:hypothetical protein